MASVRIAADDDPEFVESGEFEHIDRRAPIATSSLAGGSSDGESDPEDFITVPPKYKKK